MAPMSCLTSCRFSRRWLVLAGAFVAVFIELGTMKSFGLLVNDITSDLKTTTAVVGMAIGFSHGFSQIAIINIPLMKRFSARQLILTGALIGCLSLIFSAFSQSGAHFAWALGITGASFSIVIFPCHTCCTLDYFHDAFEKAVSVMLTGGGLGMMLLPLLVELLHHTFGWRGAVIIMGALNLHYMVTGALMKPVRTRRAPAQNQEVLEDTVPSGRYVEVPQDLGDGANDSNINAEEIRDSDKKDKYFCEQNECNKSWEDNCAQVGKTDILALSGKRIELSCEENYKEKNESEPIALQTTYCNQRTASFSDSIKANENQTVMKDSPCCKRCNFSEFLDLKLFVNNPAFMFPILVNFLFGITYTCWIVFVIPNAVAKGYTTSESAWLATTGGAANIVGRFAIGFISSRDFIQEEFSCSIICLIAAISFFCNTFASHFWSLALLSIGNGFASGAKIVMGSLLAKKTLPLEFVSTGMCYLFLSLGIAEPVGGAVMGYLYDQSQSYVLAFNMAALIEFVSSFIIIIPIVHRRLKSKFLRRKEQAGDNLGNIKDVDQTMI